MKNKIKNIFKYISAACILAILGGLLFFTNLIANVKADSRDMYTLFANSKWKIYFNNQVVAQDTLTEQEVNNATSIWLGLAENCSDYVDSYSSEIRNIDLRIELAQPINAPLFIQFQGTPGTYIQNINLYYNENATTNFETNTTNYADINKEQNYYNYIYIEFDYDNPNWEILFGYDYLSYVKGINEKQLEYNYLKQQYDNLVQSNQELQSNYNTLQQQYNDLATNDYTFENLFWSVGAVPMAFLLQAFNVDVLGMNIAAIITGLITALLIIWIIKKLIIK